MGDSFIGRGGIRLHERKSEAEQELRQQERPAKFGSLPG